MFLYTGSNAASKSPEFETSLDAKAEEEDLLPFVVVVLLHGDDDNLSVVVFFFFVLLIVLKRAKLFPEEDAELPLW